MSSTIGMAAAVALLVSLLVRETRRVGLDRVKPPHRGEQIADQRADGTSRDRGRGRSVVHVLLWIVFAAANLPRLVELLV